MSLVSGLRSAVCGLALLAGLAAAEPAWNPYPGAAKPWLQEALAAGAKGDGKANDTGALIGAIKARDSGCLLLGEGTFLIIDALPADCWVRGAGPGKTVLRLVPPFGKTGPPRNSSAAIALSSRLEGLTVEVATRSASQAAVVVGGGASLVDVVLRSIEGSGHCGLLVKGDRDPEKDGAAALVRLERVRIEGFPVGVRIEGQPSLLVAEGLELKGQGEAGLRLDGGCAALRGLKTEGCPLAVDASAADCSLVLDGAEVQGGAGVKAGGAVWVRRLKASGGALTGTGAPTGNEVPEWASRSLGRGGKGLDLPVREPPKAEIPADGWARITDYKPAEAKLIQWGQARPVSDWAPALQQAIDSGKPGVLLPPGQNYAILGAVQVRGKVQVIAGLGNGLYQVVHGSGRMYQGELVIADGAGPVEIRDLSLHLANITIRHQARRPLVLRDVSGGWYQGDDGAGELFATGTGLESMAIGQGQQAWLRAASLIHHDAPLLRNRGTVWALGLRGNHWNTLVLNEAGARAEILGGLAIATSYRPKDPLLVVAPGSQLSGSFAEWPWFEIPYTRLAADPAGTVLIKRGEAPLRGNDSEEEGLKRVPGSVLPFVALP